MTLILLCLSGCGNDRGSVAEYNYVRKAIATHELITKAEENLTSCLSRFIKMVTINILQNKNNKLTISLTV